MLLFRIIRAGRQFGLFIGVVLLEHPRIMSLQMRGITKRFGEVDANRDINLSIASGQVLGLLGENGAGKTTLMNILFGLYQPDAGAVLINGRVVYIHSPVDSIRLGIGMIHQHFMLVQSHSVTENICLGLADSPFFYPQKVIREKIREFSHRYGFDIDPDKEVWELSAGEQQKVEILKLLFQKADLLIMDEPTSVLTPKEGEEFFKIVKGLTAEGHSVILISHKLDEIMANCNKVAVLRKGALSGEAEVEAITKGELARLMIGREVSLSYNKKALSPGEEILKVRGLHVPGDRGNQAVDRVTFSVHKNEIFGIAGVAGNGQKELVEAITGLRQASGGAVFLKGDDITGSCAKVAASKGITHIPEERIKFGIVPNLLIYENSILKHHHREAFSRVFFLDYGSIKRHARALVSDFKVDTPSIYTPAKSLSGGNIQKLIIGRELEANPELLVASHPTYGLDVGAAEYIHNQLLSHREKGGAILLVSEDLDELFQLCDRVAVMFKGSFAGILEGEHKNIEEVGLMMAGSLVQEGFNGN